MEPSKLELWMNANRWSDPAFAAELSKHTAKPITGRAVYKWRHRQRKPRGGNMRAITIVTHGEITANDFYEVP